MIIPLEKTKKNVTKYMCPQSCNMSGGLYKGMQVATMLFGDMVCPTLNVDQRKEAKERVV